MYYKDNTAAPFHDSISIMRTSQFKVDEMLVPEIHLGRLRLKQGRETQVVVCGKEFQRESPAKDMLSLNKSSLGPHSEHRFPAPSSLKERCRKPVLRVWPSSWHIQVLV